MAKSSAEKPTKAIKFEPVQCPNCRSTKMEVGETVTVKTLKKAGDAAWQADGKVKLVRCLHGRCCNCGMVLDTIKQDIPIQFTSMRCVQCEKAEHLKCEIQELKLERGSYKFVAVFSCTHCGKVSAVRKFLKYLWSLVRLKVSLTGVELEFAKSKSAEPSAAPDRGGN